MQTSTRGIGWVIPLVVAVAVFAVSGAQAGSTPDPSAQLRAMHWKHEDALYQARDETSRAQIAAAYRALHWEHEERLYGAGGFASGSEQSAARTDIAVVGGGLGWIEALAGAGGMVALLTVGTAATIGIRRRHSRFARP
jgi:hypothetical protein